MERKRELLKNRATKYSLNTYVTYATEGKFAVKGLDGTKYKLEKRKDIVQSVPKDEIIIPFSYFCCSRVHKRALKGIK